jgi:CRISPR-associated protein Csx3
MYSGSDMAFSFWHKEVPLLHSLPAILIGGPPHTGKSVLTYSLTQALRKRYIDHYVIRACPDGEGDWSQESDHEAVRQMRVKGQWQPEFVQNVCYALEHRHFPLLVDVGGQPTDWQMSIMHHCTHAILLLRPGDETSTRFWLQLSEDNNLFPLARIHSVLDGTSTIASSSPVIEGILSGLMRHTQAQGPLFDLLVARIHTLFTASSTGELRQAYFNEAPAEVINLDTMLQTFTPHSERWQPEMLPTLLPKLPHDVPLAIYGRGTNWLYGALVDYAYAQPFYQFDPRLGWVKPPELMIGRVTTQSVCIDLWECDDINVLTVRLLDDYLKYTDADQLIFPAVPAGRGIILNGKLPLWLVTALVHLYNTIFDAPWVACYSPQLERAVVVVSRVTTYAPGDLIYLPLYRGSIA